MIQCAHGVRRDAETINENSFENGFETKIVRVNLALIIHLGCDLWLTAKEQHMEKCTSSLRHSLNRWESSPTQQIAHVATYIIRFARSHKTASITDLRRRRLRTMVLKIVN